jgi:hypothetical protein
MNTERLALNKNLRRKLQLGVVLLLVLFIAGYFFFMRKKPSPVGPINQTVYLQDSKLYIFDDTYVVKPYPDRILMHYPYLLIVQADKPLTTIYNLETKTKEKEIKDILLDYYQGNIIYNRKTSYFNDKDLDKYCDSAFIKSSNDILCITKQNREGIENMLIKINPEQPNLWIQVYQSKNLLTTVSDIDNQIYTGEIDIDTKQNYLSVNKQLIPVNDVVSLVYPLSGKTYLASFKSELNGKK